MGFVKRWFAGEEVVDTSPRIADAIKTTTCYMCACRCGINVHVKDGRIRYIEGNKKHPVNRGVLCAKGSAGIMQHHSPARLTQPLLRTGPRGSGSFKTISWDEALGLATRWLADVRARDPRQLAFFTGRDQSQALTGWWAMQFGTPNYAAHGGFCSVNMAAAGLYSVGGSFWEFGEPDWHRARYFLMFGVAEDHDSNPIKLGLAELKRRGAKFVSVNPVRTGYSAIADEWIAIRPGSDGLFVMALIHELLRADRIDLDYLARHTNAPWLIIDAPGTARHGLVARDAAGDPLAWDSRLGREASALSADLTPALVGEVTLADGARARPAFELLVGRCLDKTYAPDRVAERCGVPATTIRRIAAELAHAAFDQAITLEQPWTDWAGRHHATMTGRPVAMHAMRGISAHANGFHTCRAIHVLQMLLGAIDTPGSWRYKAPFPRPCPPHGRPTGGPDQVSPGQAMPGMPLGFPMGPRHLLVDGDGRPARLDKAFSWDAPLAIHGMLHMAIRNAWAGDPYPIDTLFLYMSNMAWNSAMNTSGTIAMLTDKRDDGAYKIPRFIYVDAYASETVAYADLVLPDTTYLERHDCISLLDRPIGSADGPADAIRQPVVKPDRDVRPFQDVLLDLGARLGLPGMTDGAGKPAYRDYADYMVRHERKPGIGPLAGWRGANGEAVGRGAPNPDQLERYVANGCFWRHEWPEEARYYKHVNRAYLDAATRLGLLDEARPIILQLYSETLQRFRLAGEGHGPILPPVDRRERIARHFDPLPFWHEPFEIAAADAHTYPLHAITQRPMAMYHSWGSQNAWLRQIHGRNRLFMNHATAAALGLADDDWVWIESRLGRVKGQLRLMDGVQRDTVWTWNAIGKRGGAWNLAPEAREATQGFLLNHLIPESLDGGDALANADPITGQAAWFDLRVRVIKADMTEAGESAPRFERIARPAGLERAPDRLRYGAEFKGRE